MSNSRPEILVVIPTLNESVHIENCIRSLNKAHDMHMDVVVVDGGSGDGTQAIVEGLRTEFPNLSLLHNLQKIQSAGINLAVKRYANKHHRVLIRCDAHAIYPAHFVSDLVTTLDRTGADSIVIPMDSRGSTGFGKAAAWVADTRLGAGGAPHRGGTVSGFVDHGHHAAFDLAMFRKLGGYDNSFSHNEDAEFDYRLTQAGGKIWLESAIRIEYFMRPNLTSLARQYWNYGKGRAARFRSTLCR